MAGAICWSIGSLWVASLPGVHWTSLVSPNDATGLNDPHAVVLQLLIKQVAVLLIITGVLAGAVARTRSLVLRQVRAERERTQLARYFSANLVDELADANRPLDEIRNQSVAVLFADIVGFTTLSEAEPPERVIALLREFHDRMQAAVFAHNGTLDKYLGDGLMATFGTPYPGTRDAANALAAARAMAASLAEWNTSAPATGPLGHPGRHRPALGAGGAGRYRRGEPAGIRHHRRHGQCGKPAGAYDARTLGRGGGERGSGRIALRSSLTEAEAEALLEGFIESAPMPVRGRSAQLGIFSRPRL